MAEELKPAAPERAPALPLPAFTRASDLRLDANPAQKAWLLHFMMENNIEHLLNPGIVASPEQLSFMVSLEEGQVYIPCEDELFREIYNGSSAPGLLEERSPGLWKEYGLVWRMVSEMVRNSSLDEEKKTHILALCRLRYDMYAEQGLILPARMLRRLIGIVLAQTGELDPYKDAKATANRRASEMLNLPEVRQSLQRLPDRPGEHGSIAALHFYLNYITEYRLMRLATLDDLWREDGSPEKILADIRTPCPEQNCMLEYFAGESKTVMYIPDTAGGLMADLEAIRDMLGRGWRVVLPFKRAFYFHAPNLWDLEEDPLLGEALEDALVVPDNALGKNELLRSLRESQLLVISDGTSERLNLCRAGTTFARAWKECDLIIAKGERNAEVLLRTSHSFTRDILCFWRDRENNFRMECRPKAAKARYFSERHISALAEDIIGGMRQARRAGKTVMFYSAVIGSIPGQTKTALAVVDAFVAHLREKLENTHIVNPAEHFEEGLDGDDLMFMWEKVQRSGLLDVWRFQTVEDIEASFALMGRKVPSAWSGKDSTFSTGCTKEMRIALDVQKQHPELQIIGPAPEKFFRRVEYGVGKFFDSNIKI